MTTKNYSKGIHIAALCLALAISACSNTTKPALSEHVESAAPVKISKALPTLYDDLGGEDGLRELTEKFIREIAADDKIRQRYAKTDISRFHRMMQEHLCEVTDGPCEYSGDNMKETHGGMNIQSSEFNALVEAFMRAMDSIELPIAAQNQLLEKLAKFRPDIVGQ